MDDENRRILDAESFIVVAECASLPGGGRLV